MTDESRWSLEPHDDTLDPDAPACVAGDEDPPDLPPLEGAPDA
jgi:hypothetical protein